MLSPSKSPRRRSRAAFFFSFINCVCIRSSVMNCGGFFMIANVSNGAQVPFNVSLIL